MSTAPAGRVQTRGFNFRQSGYFVRAVSQLLNLGILLAAFHIAGFDTQQFYVLPTQCIYVFCVGLRTDSNYLPIQH